MNVKHAFSICVILISLIYAGSAWALSTADFDKLMDDIAVMQEKGDLAKADAAAKNALEKGDPTQDQRAALEWEIERSRRIRKDYSITTDELFEYIGNEKRGMKDVTREEFDGWVEEGRFDYKDIDGERKFMGASRSNLFFRYPELRARKYNQSPDKWEPFLLEQIRINKNTWKQNAQLTLDPHRFNMKMTIKVKPDQVPEGEMIRCWMPYPQQYSGQAEVELLSSSPDVKWINNPTYPMRSLYFEQASKGAEPTVFQAEWNVTTWPRYVPIDPEVVAASVDLGFSDKSANEFLDEQPPHVMFTEKIRALEKKIAGDETNPAVKARKYYDWISRNVKYSYALEYSTQRNISEYVCENGYGDCGQHALLFITLCRAGGVPARWQSGWVIYPMYTGLHDWTEIYLEPYGWVPVDVDFGVLIESVMDTFDRKERNELRDFFFGGLDAFRLVVNRDHGQPHYPPKKHWRSDNVDFQRGELETEKRNIYFGEFSYKLDVEWLNEKGDVEKKKTDEKELLQPGMVR